MKTKHTVLSVVMLPLLLLGIAGKGLAQNLDLSKTVSNITTGGNGTSASQGDILQYTIVVNNLGYWNYTAAKLYDNIPAGSSYVAGSTTLNGSAVADINGAMPFSGTGASIKSSSGATGVLIPNIPATVKFSVKVTANGGNITNYAIVECDNQGTSLVQNTNTVFTNLSPDAQCSIIYETTSLTTSGVPGDGVNYRYKYIKTLNTANGTSGSIIYDGSTGPCYDAISGAALTAGSVLEYASAIAYDKNSNRIYFVNNLTTSGHNDLSYIDLNASPVCAKKYTGYPLETNTSTGYSINRMSFCSDGYGYAVTSNGMDLIRFSINTSTLLPDIVRLGALIDDSNNGSNQILSEGGGDIFGDGSGNLYLVANSSNLYKINPNTRVSTFLGSISPYPGTSNSMAVDAAGNVYVGGAYRDVFKVNLASMTAASITGGSTSNVWTNGDYTSCAFPVLAPALVANKSYRNINGLPEVVGGDTIEYVITVTNTGNLNASGVKLYDYIPTSTEYIPGTTKINGVSVADNTGNIMPYSVTGGKLINSTGESAGIVKPGTAYSVTLTFWVKTIPDAYICNQSRVFLFDMNGNTIFVNSNDTTQGSGQNATCFYAFGILPAENLSFKASLVDQSSLLQWNVKNEHNIAYYEIEFSADGTNFTNAGKVTSKGNIEGTNSYQFTDHDNQAAVSRYYRLKIYGTNGSFTYSAILRLSLGNLQVTKIQPNPFERNINIQLYLKSADKLSIRLVDMYGRVVYASSQQLGKGTHSLNVQTPAGLPKGAYVIQFVAGTDQVYQEKLIKK